MLIVRRGPRKDEAITFSEAEKFDNELPIFRPAYEQVNVWLLVTEDCEMHLGWVETIERSVEFGLFLLDVGDDPRAL